MNSFLAALFFFGLPILRIGFKSLEAWKRQSKTLVTPFCPSFFVTPPLVGPRIKSYHKCIVSRCIYQAFWAFTSTVLVVPIIPEKKLLEFHFLRFWVGMWVWHIEYLRILSQSRMSPVRGYRFSRIGLMFDLWQRNFRQDSCGMFVLTDLREEVYGR